MNLITSCILVFELIDKSYAMGIIVLLPSFYNPERIIMSATLSLIWSGIFTSGVTDTERIIKERGKPLHTEPKPHVRG
jgi:hypothetical protein